MDAMSFAIFSHIRGEKGKGEGEGRGGVVPHNFRQMGETVKLQTQKPPSKKPKAGKRKEKKKGKGVEHSLCKRGIHRGYSGGPDLINFTF